MRHAAAFAQEDARDYLVTGCWGTSGNGNEKSDHGNYVNLLKAFEFSVHNRRDKMADCQLYFRPLDGAKSFVGILKEYSDDGAVTVASGKKELSFTKAQTAQVRLHVSI